jgi:hypothetical protein
MHKTSYLLILACIFILTPISCIRVDYILPTPDNRENASPPSISGILKKVTGNYLQVAQNGEKEIQHVKYTRETAIFTEAGGMVYPEKLISGGPVNIWYTQITIEENLEPPVAAVVIVPKRNTN